ncbi:MAG: DNA repair protein RadC [Proteobacteria bacterium]|nr:DNA repair protein RadC [Burkholderiales bacterium]
MTSIKHWPTGERPREKLRARGADALSDAELLAILLRHGGRGMSAVDLGRDLIRRFGSIGALLLADERSFCAAPGLGPARFVEMQAMVALMRRMLRETLRDASVLDSPQDVRDYLKLSLAAREYEVFVAVFLDTQHRILVDTELFRGTLSQTSVYPREVVKAALAANAAAVIFAHNHPSGVAEPSRSDELLTRALKDALALVDVRVLDHFVVARGGVVSFAERGLL